MMRPPGRHLRHSPLARRHAVTVSVALRAGPVAGVVIHGRGPGAPGADWGSRGGRRSRGGLVLLGAGGGGGVSRPRREHRSGSGRRAAAAVSGGAGGGSAALGGHGRGGTGVVVVGWTLAQERRSARRATWRAAVAAADSRRGRCMRPRTPGRPVKAESSADDRWPKAAQSLERVPGFEKLHGEARDRKSLHPTPDGKTHRFGQDDGIRCLDFDGF